MYIDPFIYSNTLNKIRLPNKIDRNIKNSIMARLKSINRPGKLSI